MKKETNLDCVADPFVTYQLVGIEAPSFHYTGLSTILFTANRVYFERIRQLSRIKSITYTIFLVLADRVISDTFHHIFERSLTTIDDYRLAHGPTVRHYAASSIFPKADLSKPEGAIRIAQFIG